MRGGREEDERREGGRWEEGARKEEGGREEDERREGGR